MRGVAVFLTCLFVGMQCYAPVWAPGDKWFYEMKIGVEGDRIKGEWFIENASVIVTDVEEYYTVEIEGNLTGNIEAEPYSNIAPLDGITGGVTGVYYGKNLLRKSDLATISSEIKITGNISSIKILPFYIQIKAVYNPPYATLQFPLETGMEWHTSTTVTITGRIYVEGMLDEDVNSTEEIEKDFRCIGRENVSVKAGDFTAYHITDENTEIWYAESVQNVIKSLGEGISIKNNTFNIETELIAFDIISPPSISIDKPKPNRLYLFDKEIMSLKNKTIVIGKISIETSVESESGVERVEFYFNDELKYTDYDAPYKWSCMEKSFGNVVVKCIAYDIYGKNDVNETSFIYINL